MPGLLIKQPFGLGQLNLSSNYVISCLQTTGIYDIFNCTSGTFQVTLPAASAATPGYYYVIKNSGSGVITINTQGGNIDGSSTLVLNQKESVQAFSDGSNWIIMGGSASSTSGTAGSSGSTGTSGSSGTAGTSGSSGSSGTSGTSGSSGSSGANGSSGSSGTSGNNGTSGSSGTSGTSGSSGSSGTTGTSGSSGSSGTTGTSGSSGSTGSSGSSGTSGSSGSSGTSGANGANGSSGSSGSSGTSGANGANGSSGTSGANGANGSSGTSGANGANGSSGSSGASGTSGTGFNTITSPENFRVLISNGGSNTAFCNTNIYVDNTNSYVYANAFFQNSSRKLKTNIEPLNCSAIDLLSKVDVVKFNYLNDLENPHIGFIAEDTPVELSTKNQNAMDTNSVVGVLIKAIQELSDELNRIKNAQC